jgi:hypothetical protein
VVYFVNTNGRITLPRATTAGQMLIFLATSQLTGVVNLASQGTDVIRDPTLGDSATLDGGFFTATLLSDGSGHWYVLTRS